MITVMMRNLVNVGIVLSIFGVLSCSNSNKTEGETTETTSEFVHISKQNFEFENMLLGEYTPFEFEEKVVCNGIVSAPHNGIFKLNLRLSGRIDAIHCALGDEVKKGQLLVEVSSNKLIELQQEYMKTIALQKQIVAEYNRSKKLFDENVGTEKDLLAAESQLMLNKADYNALKLKLQLLNLDLDRIEQGDLYASYPVYSAINANVTQLGIVMGQYVENQTTIVELVDMNKLQLDLSVFEKDISLLSLGDAVEFTLVDENNVAYEAEISAIAKSINTVSKTIECKAKISTTKKQFILGSFIQANIVYNKKQSFAIPRKAVVKRGNEYYVFVVDNQDEDGWNLKTKAIQIGISSREYYEVLNPDKQDEILLSGAYNLPLE